MEIHPPEQPILTLREFFVHIGTVTIGILIALSLEGLVEWNHHRHLIREARENIRTEIEDNQREMTGHLSSLPKNLSDGQNVLKWVTDLQNNRKSPIHSLTIGFNRADLSNTSWTTAQAVGALGLLEYSEVKRDAAIYELQDEFQRLQTRAEDSTVSAMTFFTSNSDHPENAAKSDLEDERRRVQASLTAVQVQGQIGTELQKRYASLLGRK